MKKQLLLVLSFCFISALGNLKAAIYIPTPLEDQVKDSYGVIRGTYSGKVFKKNSKGEVITEISIVLNETSGLKPGDIINKNNFKVTFPGGNWQGIVHQVSGSPNFKQGEDVVLLLVKGNNGFHLLNFGLGKYTIEREAGAQFVISDIFPNNTKISGLRYENFQKIIENKFGYPMTEFKGEKFVYKPKREEEIKSGRSSRAPASIGASRAPAEESSTAMFWLMIILSVLGTSSYKIFNRKR